MIAVPSPKGGVGKTTVTLTLVDLLAGHGRLQVAAVDLNPDFGTLASLVPDQLRAPREFADLLERLDTVNGKPGLGPYMSKLPSGLNVLAAPEDPGVMRELTPELYGRVFELLRLFYDIVLLDLGTGIVDELTQFGIRRADQVVVVTTPQVVTAEKVLAALPFIASEGGWNGAGDGRLDRVAVVLNQAAASATHEQRAVEEAFRRAGVSRRVVLPYDDQLALTLGFVKRFELAEVGSVGAGDLGDVKRQVVVEALGGLPVGAIELGAELLECPLWLRVKAQARADLWTRRLPRGSVEQRRPRVGEATRAWNEHVAAIQRGL
jgi:MinD-like ATPase involved in chromosome partitioning or flagellar assembly